MSRISPLLLALTLWGVLLIPAHAGAGLRVVVTIKPIHSLLAGLMRDSDSPALLMDGDRPPFAYTPDNQQLEQLAAADLLIWVGPELESSLASVVGSLPPRVRVVELLASPELKILPSRTRDDRRDPYFWLDSRNIVLLVNSLTGLLQELDAPRAHVYERNHRQLLQRLGQIDREYEYGYRGLKAGLAVQYHDTLHYFEQAYALSVIERVAESPGEPLDTARLLRVRQRLSAGEAVCVLTEAGLPDEHLALLTDGLPVNRGRLNSLGVGLPAGPDLYFQVMRHNTEVIKGCLKAGQGAPVAGGHLPQEDGLSPAEDPAGDRFILVDHLGGAVSREDMLGKFQILYFGYTYCPDICPTSLAVLSRALTLLGDKADLIRPYFITIDPERDTVQVMRNYVGYFDQRLIGLTGPREMIDRAAARYRVKYAKVLEEGNPPDRYLMDHSASLYLLGPDGRFITKFLHGISAQQLHDELLRFLP